MASLSEIMRKRFLIIFLALSFIVASGAAVDTKETEETDVQSVLKRFPAQSAVERDQLASELLHLGSQGILKVCRKIVPPGTGDDTQARYALHALTTYTNQKGLERARELYAKTLAKALEKTVDREVKAFVIRQLQQVGKEESVKPLKKCLIDQRLCEPAAQALLSIGTEEAEKALLRSLGKTCQACRITIIKALGEMRCRKAAKKILRYAYSTDKELRQVTLFALANIGDPLADRVLKNISVTATSYERIKAPTLYLLYARRLAESGNTEKCGGICRRLIKNYTAPQESHISCQALSVLADVWGDKAFGDVLQAVGSPNQELRWTALELAERFPGEEATSAWLERMAEVPPEVQAEIIIMLGKRGEKAALPALRQKLKSQEKIVRLAAIPAVSCLGGSHVLSGLMPLLQNGEAEEVQAVKRALLGFPGDLVIPEAVQALDKVPPVSQAALLEVLSEKHAREQVDVVFCLTENENEDVRRAALAALENMVNHNDLSRVIQLLLNTGNARERRLVQNAVVASANQIPEPEKRAHLLIEVLKKTEGEKRAILLRPFSHIGGKKALQTVIEETKSDDIKVQTAAVFVLADWPDLAAADELFRICRETTEKKFLLIAMSGYVRLIVESNLDENAKFLRLIQAMDVTSDNAAKGIVFNGLGKVKTAQALGFVIASLDDKDMQSHAARAAGEIFLSAPELDWEKELSSPESLSVLIKSARLVQDNKLQRRMDRLIQVRLREEGFVPLFNGKDLTGWKGLVGNPVIRSQMSTEELKRAQEDADTIMRAHWKGIDGILVFDGEGENLCTVKEYEDFELLVDWKIEKSGDSGIYLRGSPQVQIWDPAQWPEGSGGLYNNKVGPSKPLEKADNPVGQWNTSWIKIIGERVTVFLNDVLVVDDVVMENYWERDKPIYAAGQIELQAHNTPLYFRNIYIRELPLEESINKKRSIERSAQGLLRKKKAKDLESLLCKNLF
jgi:HEAT repeat protein